MVRFTADQRSVEVCDKEADKNPVFSVITTIEHT